MRDRTLLFLDISCLDGQPALRLIEVDVVVGHHLFGPLAINFVRILLKEFRLGLHATIRNKGSLFTCDAAPAEDIEDLLTLDLLLPNHHVLVLLGLICCQLLLHLLVAPSLHLRGFHFVDVSVIIGANLLYLLYNTTINHSIYYIILHSNRVRSLLSDQY